MSTIENIKTLVDGLHSLVHSNYCDMEMYCTDDSGNKIVGVSELDVTTIDERMCLASVVILEKIKNIISKEYENLDFDRVCNETDKRIVIHGVRVVIKIPGCQDIIRDWKYPYPKKLWPDDKLAIHLCRTAIKFSG